MVPVCPLRVVVVVVVAVVAVVEEVLFGGHLSLFQLLLHNVLFLGAKYLPVCVLARALRTADEGFVRPVCVRVCAHARIG